MMQHLPILLIVVPLMSGPLFVLIRERKLVYGAAVAISWLTFFGCFLLLQQTLERTHVCYEIGGWKRTWGIEYRIDALSGLVMLFVSFIGAAVVTFGTRQRETRDPAAETIPVLRDVHALPHRIVGNRDYRRSV